MPPIICSSCHSSNLVRVERYVMIVDTEKSKKDRYDDYMPLYLCKSCFKAEFINSSKTLRKSNSKKSKNE